MNGTFAVIALAFALACSSSPALSADASVSATRSNHFSVEVNPLPLIVNAVPGSHGFAGSLEIPLVDHIAAFGAASYISLKLPEAATEKAESTTATGSREAAPSTTMRELMISSARGGLRYYGNIGGDSWYAGVDAGTATSRAAWTRNGESLADKSVLYTAGLEAGYRWIWNSGFLMRIGGQLNTNSLRSRTISAASASSQDAIDDVTKAGDHRKSSLSTGFDLGLGWAF